MIFLLIFPILFTEVNADALNKFQEEMDAGAEWHHVGEQDLDPNAKSIDVEGKFNWGNTITIEVTSRGVENEIVLYQDKGMDLIKLEAMKG